MKRNIFINKIEKMYGNSIESIEDLTGGLEASKMFYIIAPMFKYLLNENEDKVISQKSVLVRRKLNILIKKLGKYFLSSPQIIEDRNALLARDGEQFVQDKGIDLPNESVIVMSNHAFKDDIVASILASKRHTYLLLASLPHFYNTFDAVSSFINGITLINRNVKNSKKTTIPKAKKVLEYGADYLMFPEGVWNKQAESLVIYLWPGIYRIAKETGTKIVPVIHYLRDMDKPGKDNPIHTVIDDPIDVSNLTEKEALAILRDKIATWTYLMMEKYGNSTRKEVLDGYSSYDEAWEAELNGRLSQIKYYDKRIETSSNYRPKEIVNPEDVWRDLANLEPDSNDDSITYAQKLTSMNYARKLIKERDRRNFQNRY